MSRVPRATYRLQLRKEFGFAAAAAIVPYLARLGISHLYLSPVTAARPGSTHGYDVIDYNQLNPELGGEIDFTRLSETARANGLGIIIDFVPNHMAASTDNAWWRDVLHKGQGSRYAGYFDIDWKRFDGFRHPAVTLPYLSKPYEKAIRDIELEDDHIVCNGVKLPRADGSSGDDVAHVLAQQHFRLIRWQDAPQQINYRRFFDINDLVGMNADAAFDDTHQLVSRLAKDGMIDGLRLDHIDGLRDPATYCERLRALLSGSGLQDPYLLVEKILDADEQLPDFPGVHGTTGYEALNLLTRSFMDRDGLAELDRIWRETCKGCDDVEMREAAKRQILDELFPAGLEDLSRRMPKGSKQELTEYLVRLPVYRTYVTERGPSEADRKIVEQATQSPDLRQALLAPSEFVFRLQQFSGPVMAKSIEDTLFYRNFRLLALNEVGGGSELQPLAPPEFHHAIAQRQRTQPHGLIATATHDTKRGEDARLRIAALSFMTEEWARAVSEFPQEAALSRRHIYMICQSLLGAWPLEGVSEGFAGRAKEFALKAVREGKEKSRWTAPDEKYEAALTGFIDRLLLWDDTKSFRDDFLKLVGQAALLGAIASLAQLTLKATLPGVPDFYQGCESWDLSFVDPDNRRPVDYATRHAALSDTPEWHALCRDWQTGAVKIALTHQLLSLRQKHTDLFAYGDYQPLTLDDRLIAFKREHEGASVVVAVCRDPTDFMEHGNWPDFSSLQVTLKKYESLQPVLQSGALPVAVWAGT